MDAGATGKEIGGGENSYSLALSERGAVPAAPTVGRRGNCHSSRCNFLLSDEWLAGLSASEQLRTTSGTLTTSARAIGRQDDATASSSGRENFCLKENS